MGAVLGISNISVVALFPPEKQVEVQLYQHRFRVHPYRGNGGNEHKDIWIPSDCVLLLILCLGILYGAA